MAEQNSYLFSVVIPTHHRPDFLKRAIQALEEQSLKLSLFEVIVVLSPDDSSLSWLESYDTSLNLTYKVPEDDQWAGKNVSFKRNYGARLGQASWIAFTDDDCAPHSSWLEKAVDYRDKQGVVGVEGKTLTPEDSPRTLTWKGMQRLSRPGGFQTCNVFYKKDIFLKSGGFDSVNFPWFLEDTDLAWSMLQFGEIAFEPESIVIHPVGPAAPWRVIHEAKGAGLKVKLFQKFPAQYRQRNMKILRFSHWIYLGIYFSLVTVTSLQYWSMSLVFLCVLFMAHGVHLIKLFKGVKARGSEMFAMSWRLLLFPVVALFSTFRMALEKRLSLSDILKLIV